MIQVKRKTITIITRLFIAIAICLTVSFGLKVLSEKWKEGIVTQYPRKTLGVVIDLAQREEFFEQLKLFADNHNFYMRIGQITPTGDKFNIYISGEGITLITNNVFHPTAYDISFYDRDPSNPVSEEVINNLLQDLKRFINEVPNIRIFD